MPGAEVRPVAIVDITGDEDEGDFLLESKVDDCCEGATAGSEDLPDRSALAPGQPAQRGVQMEIGAVEEACHGPRLVLFRCLVNRNLLEGDAPAVLVADIDTDCLHLPTDFLVF